MPSRARSLAAYGLLIWGAWSLFAVFEASQLYMARAYSGGGENWTAPTVRYSQAFQYAAVDSYVWALLTPLALLLAGRLVVRRANWWWTLPVLFVASVVLAVAHFSIFVRLLTWAGYRRTPAVVRTLLFARFHSNLLTCWILFGIRHAMEYYRQYRLRELTASQLEAKLALSQLEVLKMQLQPHFLFNTLHAISALMYRSVESADRMVARLSDFLRLTLDSAGVQEVTLKREMEYLDKYLDIEQVRFGDRLQVSRAIDPETLDLLVPNLVLQPLVENAVRHGIAPLAEGGHVEVAARLERGSLVVEVVDDGKGPGAEIREGLGLSNTRARLEQLYGKECKLELGGGARGGFRARLILPAHSESQHASPDRR